MAGDLIEMLYITPFAGASVLEPEANGADITGKCLLIQAFYDLIACIAPSPMQSHNTRASRDVGLQHAHAIAFRIENGNVSTDSGNLHRLPKNLAARLDDPLHRGIDVIHRDND